MRLHQPHKLPLAAVTSCAAAGCLAEVGVSGLASSLAFVWPYQSSPPAHALKHCSAIFNFCFFVFQLQSFHEGEWSSRPAVVETFSHGLCKPAPEPLHHLGHKMEASQHILTYLNLPTGLRAKCELVFWTRVRNNVVLLRSPPSATSPSFDGGVLWYGGVGWSVSCTAATEPET